MPRKKQTEFHLPQHRSWIGKSFGGARTSHPKAKRPFSSRHLMHVILKSSHARGRRSFLHFKHKKMVDRSVYKLAEKAGVIIQDYVNVGNHLHLLVKASNQAFLTRFLRSLGGILPRRVCGCEKGSPLGFKFWDGRPFTKIVAVGFRPFQTIKKYFVKNNRQATSRWLNIRVEGFDFRLEPDTG